VSCVTNNVTALLDSAGHLTALSRPASWWETHSPRILQSVLGLAVLELMPFSLGGVRPEEPKFKA